MLQDTAEYDIDPVSLTFEGPGREAAFVKLKHARLVLLSILAACLFFALSGIVFSWSAYIDWSTCGHVYVSTELGRRMGGRRTIFLAFLCSISALVAVFGVLCNKFGILSPRMYEIGVAFLWCVLCVLAFLQHPYVFCRVHAYSVAESMATIARAYSEDELILIVHFLVTAFTLMLPVRWALSFLLDVVMVVSSIVYLIVLSPSPTHAIFSWGLLLLVTLCISIGKRSMEASHRIAFIHIAKERSLRAEAEHQLSCASVPDQSDRPPRAETDNTSMTTASIFQSAGENGDSTDGFELQQVVGLGLREHWLIPQERIRVFPDDVLGRGGFGVVCVGLFHGCKVAVKISRGAHQQKHGWASVMGELRIFRRLRNPSIVIFYGACVDPDTMDIALVLEHILGQTLRAAIPRSAPTSLVEMVGRLRLADDVCCALTYLHAQKPVVIHGDIKDSNILVEMRSGELKARLLDFGLSRLLTRGAEKLGGSLRWAAPEVLAREQDCTSPAADVFSFGRLLYMISTGLTPLRASTESGIVEHARRGQCPELDWPESMPLLEEISGLCEACMAVEPNSRIVTVEVQRSLRTRLPSACGNGGDCEFSHALQQLRGRGSKSPASEKKAREELVHPSHLETPIHSRLFSIAFAMSSWNYARPSSACSAWHAALVALEALHKRMVQCPCRPFDSQGMEQCQQCLLMGSANECLRCGDLGGTSKSAATIAEDLARGSSEVASAPPAGNITL